MKHHLLKLVVVFTTALAVAACKSSNADNSTGPLGFCTATRPIALMLGVRDSVSSRALADGATGIIMLGATSDTLVHQDTLILYGGTQTGTYNVTVQRAGYHTWTRAGVSASQTGLCGNVVTVNLTALLQPLS
jgi:hypothetical protein